MKPVTPAPRCLHTMAIQFLKSSALWCPGCGAAKYAKDAQSKERWTRPKLAAEVSQRKVAKARTARASAAPNVSQRKIQRAKAEVIAPKRARHASAAVHALTPVKRTRRTKAEMQAARALESQRIADQELEHQDTNASSLSAAH